MEEVAIDVPLVRRQLVTLTAVVKSALAPKPFRVLGMTWSRLAMEGTVRTRICHLYKEVFGLHHEHHQTPSKPLHLHFHFKKHIPITLNHTQLKLNTSNNG